MPPSYGPATWSPIPQQTPRGGGAVPGLAQQPDPWASTGYPSPTAYPQAMPVHQPVSAGYPVPTGYQPLLVPNVVSAMPDGPRTYPQMLRGPRRRWWRPLVALLLAGAIAFVGQIVAFGPFIVFGAISTGGRGLGQWLMAEIDKLSEADIDAAGFLYTNLSLIVLIPAAGLSIWAVHHIRPRFVSSVVGGFRWRWLLRCLAVVIPVWVLYIGVGLLIDRPAWDRPAEWVVLLFLVVFMTPLQAAGEEYFFRGWILQNVGSWFKRPMLSLVVGTAVSATAFSAAHGSPDPWILGSLAVFAISCCLLTWRTGGLEAAIAIHAVNNIAAFATVINFGGWDEAFIGGDTKGDPVQFALDAAVQVIAFALIWWQAKRAKISWRYRPGMPQIYRDAPLPVLPPPPSPQPSQFG